MKNLLILILLISSYSFAQISESHTGVKKACINYIEGFYEGDESKLKECLQPSLNKFGFWKNNDSGRYHQEDYMSYDKALEYARNVLDKKHFPSKNAPKIVTVLDIGNVIASAKVKAWWGIDYILLSKRGDKWMIEQVLWEGPL